MTKLELNRYLNTFALFSITIGGIIGAGIFVFPVAIASYAGPSVLISLLIATLIVILVAMAYTEFSSSFQKSAAPYALPRAALGNFGGFFMGWCYFLFLFIGSAAIINLFVVYLGRFIPVFVQQTALTSFGTGFAIIILWIITFYHSLGIKWSAKFAIYTTIIKLVLIFAFIVMGLYYFNPKNFSPFMPYDFSGILIVIPFLLWEFSSFASSAILTSETIDSNYTIVKSMKWSILISFGVFLLICLVFVGVIDWDILNLHSTDWVSLKKIYSPYEAIAASMKQTHLTKILLFSSLFAGLSSMGNRILIQGRIPFAMAQDGVFFNYLSKINPEFKTPISALFFGSALSTLLLLIIPDFSFGMLFSCFPVLLPYGVSMISIAILRNSYKDVPRFYKMPKIKILAPTGFVLISIIMYLGSWPWTMINVFLVCSAYPAYFIVTRRKNIEFKRNLWIPIYLIGIMIISIFGSKKFIYNNFTNFEPFNYLRTPLDLIVLTIFSLSIFYWVYKINIKKVEMEKKVQLPS